MHRCAILTVADVVRLQQTVHDAALRDIERKKSVFVQTVAMDQLIILDTGAVDGVILTERALVDPTIGEDKKILGHNPGTLERFITIQIDFGIDDVDTQPGGFFCHSGDNGEPLLGFDLPVDGGSRLSHRRIAAQTDHLDEKPSYPETVEQGGHPVEMFNIETRDRIN